MLFSYINTSAIAQSIKINALVRFMVIMHSNLQTKLSLPLLHHTLSWFNHFSSIEIYNINLVLFVKVLQAWQQTHTNALINGGMCGVRLASTVPTREIPGVCGDSSYECRLCFDSCEPLQNHNSIKEGLYIGRSV